VTQDNVQGSIPKEETRQDIMRLCE